MGLISGPNKADDTCGRTTVTGTMDRGFTVYKVKFTLEQAMKTQRGSRVIALLSLT
jgi:hypothetical protein